MTITEFLNARCDEEERDWRVVACRDVDYQIGGRSVAPMMLADIAAKRAIVEVFEEAARDVDAIDYDYGADDEDWGAVSLLRDVLRLLAQPYAEHADFDPAWRV